MGHCWLRLMTTVSSDKGEKGEKGQKGALGTESSAINVQLKETVTLDTRGYGYLKDLPFANPALWTNNNSAFEITSDGFLKVLVAGDYLVKATVTSQNHNPNDNYGYSVASSIFWSSDGTTYNLSLIHI